nr:hypothetical protein StreXyl84_33650 [Streptomyces sp. Xyl84]
MISGARTVREACIIRGSFMIREACMIRGPRMAGGTGMGRGARVARRVFGGTAAGLRPFPLHGSPGRLPFHGVPEHEGQFLGRVPRGVRGDQGAEGAREELRRGPVATGSPPGAGFVENFRFHIRIISGIVRAPADTFVIHAAARLFGTGEDGTAVRADPPAGQVGFQRTHRVQEIL